MGAIVAAITVDEGTVLATEVSGSARSQGNLLQLNDRVAVMLHDSLLDGKEFFEDHLQELKTLDFDELISKAKTLFEEFCKTKKGKAISIHIIGYTNFYEIRPYHLFLFDGAQSRFWELAPTFHFYGDDQLGKYFCFKTYTRSLPLDKATELLAYIMTQYNSVYVLKSNSVELVSITDKGFYLLTEDETKPIIKRVQQVHIELRKSCYDLFVKRREEYRT